MKTWVVISTITSARLSPARDTAEEAERDRRMLARPEVAEVVEVQPGDYSRIAPCLGRKGQAA